MKILVTGCSGYVGKSLANKLVAKDSSNKNEYVFLLGQRKDVELNDYPHKKYIQVSSVDIRKKTDLKKYFQNVDCVIHLAAKVQYTRKGKKDFYEVNVKGTQNIFELSIENNVKKVIYLSTAAIYHPKKVGSINENDDISKVNQLTHYTKSKSDAFKKVSVFQKKGLNIISILPSSVISFDAPLFRPIFSLCRKYKFCVLPSKGGHLSYIILDDLLDFITFCINTDLKNETFFLTQKDLELAKLIKKIGYYSNKKYYVFRLPNFLLRIFFWIKGFIFDPLSKESFFNYELFKIIDSNFLVKSSKNTQEFTFRNFENELKNIAKKQ